MEALEGLTLAVVAIGIVLSCVGYIRSRDGQMVLPRPIRQPKIDQRRTQMMAYVVSFMCVGGIVWFRYNALVGFLIVGMLLILVTLQQVYEWSEFERIVGDASLTSDEHTDVQLSLDTRPIAHEINGLTAVLIADMTQYMVDASMSDADRDRIQSTIDDLYRLADMHRQLQILIQAPTKS